MFQQVSSHASSASPGSRNCYSRHGRGSAGRNSSGVDTEAGNVTIHPASESTQDEIYEPHSDSNEAAWCFCTAWWTSTWDGFGRRTSEENRALRDELFRTGHYDGYLLQI